MDRDSQGRTWLDKFMMGVFYVACALILIAAIGRFVVAITSV